MRSDIREGVTLPDYELEDQAGRRRSLSKLQGGNAMVVHLSRGGYEPRNWPRSLHLPGRAVQVHRSRPR